MKVSQFAKFQLPLLLWLALIYSISAIPSVPVVKFPISPDKIAHAGIYFVLCMLSKRAFYHQDRWEWLRDHSLLGAFLFTVLYGILDEVHQMYVPGRSPDIYDAMADAFGALLFGGWTWYSVKRKQRRK